jgi:PKD repeat protein
MKLRLLHYFIISFLLVPFLSFQLDAQVIANFTANKTSGCAPLSVNFTNTSTGAITYSWDFGNGNTSTLTNPGATYNTAGVYSVVLTATNGASSNTHTVSISVFANPIPNFTTISPSCVGQVVPFTDNSIAGSGSLTTWAWDFGDGSNQTTNTGLATHTYVAGGTFPVTLIVTNSNGCSKSIINNVTILAAPHADFTGSPSSACVPPISVDFTTTSTFVGAVTYLWNFGDGNASTLANPSHTYNFTGSYNIALEITQQGCKDTMTKLNYVVIEDIVPDFSANDSSVCAGQVISFTDLSVPLSVSRTWDFGDGATSTLANPTHTYATAGTYAVSLLNATAIGCTHSIIKNNFITVFPIPVVSFAANKTKSCVAPFSVNFTDNSTNAASWNWDFGDGNTSTLKNPTHVYAVPGSYTVKLVVTSANGCQTTLIKNNYIFISSPVASFTATPLEGCIPLKVDFTSTSTSPADAIVNYIWDFGNGTATSVIPTISQTYAAVGVYTVKLIIATALGCKDTLTKVNYVKAGTPPTANFSVVTPTVCWGTPAEFTDLSVGADSAHWEFDIKQGTFDTPFGAAMPFNPVLHPFPDTDTFFVRQIAFNKGCPDTFQINNAVRILPPKPIFSYLLNCLTPHSVSFTDASQGADSIVWDFLDGSPVISNVHNPTHIYVSEGPQSAQLTAFNFTTGCSKAIIQTFAIANPKAKFTSNPDTGCYSLPVHFTNLSIDADTVTWRFGDGSPNSTDTTNFFHTYLLPGKYPVTLTITDVNGCMDSAKSTVVVYGPLPDFKADTLMGCTPFLVNFTDISVSDSTLIQWTWDFGDGTPPQIIASKIINHTYTVPGLYSVTMTVKDKNGCVKTASKINYIQPTFPTPLFVADTFACKKQAVVFDASTTNVAFPATFDWNFGDGTNGAGMFTTHFYSSDSLYTIKLTVTDKNGCVSSVQHQLRIQTPVAAFTYSVISQACGVSNIQFTDHSTGLGINSWQWSFGDGASAGPLQPNPIHVYTKPGLFPVTLVVSNIAGCTDTSLLDSLLVLGPVGTFSFTPDRGCVPLLVTFTAVSNNATNYNWDFGDGTIINTTNPVIQHLYTTVATKTPILLLGNVLPDGSACQFPAPTAGFIVVTTDVTVKMDSVLNVLCNGDSTGKIFSSASGGTMPYSYSWSTNPVQTFSTANNLKVGSYTVTVTDSNFCVTPAVALITQPTPVITTAGVNDTVCPGKPAVLIAIASGGSGNYYYIWQPGGIVNAGTLHITPTTDSVFTVTAYDKNNCAGTSVTTSAIVYKLNPDSIHVMAKSSCLDKSISVSVQTSGLTGTLTYQWNPNIGNGPGVYHVTPLVPTTYVTKITNACGSFVTDSVAVPKAYPLPIANFSVNSTHLDLPYDVTTCRNQSFNATTYHWDFGDGFTSTQFNPSHLYTSVGIFQIQLIAISPNGCSDTSYIQVTTSADVVFPNAFTPDSKSPSGGAYDITSLDNDIFFPYTSGVVEYKFQIFNRWGELIFESLDVKIGWDGYYKGHLCQQDVYVWKAYIKHNNGKVFNKSGDVTLLR